MDGASDVESKFVERSDKAEKLGKPWPDGDC